MAKFLKNTTGSDISIKETGDTIAASTTIEIDPTKYQYYAKSEAITEVTPLINSGDLVVVDDVMDLTAARGIDFLKYPDTAFNNRFLSQPERMNGFNAKNVQEAIEEGRNSFEGKGFQTAFIGNGTVANEWLKSEDANILSHQSPDIFKFNAKCVGIDFTNSNNGADPIVIICISNAGSGRNLDRFYKWTLVNKRVCSNVNQTLGFTVNAGDKMAIYVRDGGGNSRDVIITMDFLVTSVINGEISENYNNDFRSNDIPATGSIQEIFT